MAVKHGDMSTDQAILNVGSTAVSTVLGKALDLSKIGASEKLINALDRAGAALELGENEVQNIPERVAPKR